MEQSDAGSSLAEIVVQFQGVLVGGVVLTDVLSLNVTAVGMTSRHRIIVAPDVSNCCVY